MPSRPSKARVHLVVDRVTSERLGRVRQQGTSPELTVRKIIHRMGHRFRVDNRDLPGSPDIANRTRKWAIFVHGCFWHRHAKCIRATTPKRNRNFWLRKFQQNTARDRRVVAELRANGWAVLTLWECEIELTPNKLERSLNQIREKRASYV